MHDVFALFKAVIDMRKLQGIGAQPPFEHDQLLYFADRNVGSFNFGRHIVIGQTTFFAFLYPDNPVFAFVQTHQVVCLIIGQRGYIGALGSI